VTGADSESGSAIRLPTVSGAAAADAAGDARLRRPLLVAVAMAVAVFERDGTGSPPRPSVEPVCGVSASAWPALTARK
jgi:hypothetical protein